MPIKTGQGKFLIKRKSWNGKEVFQIVNDSDSGKINAKSFIPVFVKSNRSIGKLLSKSACSSNLFLLKEEKYYLNESADVKIIDPKKWIEVGLEEGLKVLGVGRLEYRIADNTRPNIRLVLGKELELKNINKILNHELLKPRKGLDVKFDLCKKILNEEKKVKLRDGLRRYKQVNKKIQNPPKRRE